MERNTVGPDGPRPPQHSATNGGHETTHIMPRKSASGFGGSRARSGPVVAPSGMFADLMGSTRPAGTGWISQCAPIGVSRVGNSVSPQRRVWDC